MPRGQCVLASVFAAAQAYCNVAVHTARFLQKVQPVSKRASGSEH
jgi:hypothetical protein